MAANHDGTRRRQAYVLVVEDDEALRESLRELLESTGAHTRTAKHGAEAAYVIARDGAPRSVVTDLHMPVADGLSLVRALRSKRFRRAIPVLLMTGDGVVPPLPGDVEVARKPIPADVLLRFVERHASAAPQVGRGPPSAEASNVEPRPTLVVSPARDRVFAEFAEMIVDHGVGSLKQLEQRIRAVYPSASVHRRDLPDKPWVVWFIYRDGRADDPNPGLLQREKTYVEPWR